MKITLVARMMFLIRRYNYTCSYVLFYSKGYQFIYCMLVIL